MAEWRSESVGDCLDHLSVGPKVKMQTSGYKAEGQYPIIDQGREFIAGWTDDASGLISEGLPVVVFGDHTRAFKYIDFPFVRGADGTQILKPKLGIEPLFFYYALQSIDLLSRGYNRHFKELKESLVPLAPENEQLQISNLLLRIDNIRSVQESELICAERVKRAAMQSLFTKGLRGQVQKETEIGKVPESWELMPISGLGQVVTGNTPPTRDASNYDGGTIPFVSPGDIEHGCRIQATAKRITEKGLATVRPIPAGATYVVCIGSTIGKVGYSTREITATNQQINSVIPSSDFDPNYVFYLMNYWSGHVKSQASPSPVPILSKGAFEKISIYSSRDPTEQRGIVAVLDPIDRKIALHKRKRAVLDELFQALLHKLMKGEIRVSDLDLSPLEPMKEVAV